MQQQETKWWMEQLASPVEPPRDVTDELKFKMMCRMSNQMAVIIAKLYEGKPNATKKRKRVSKKKKVSRAKNTR